MVPRTLFVHVRSRCGICWITSTRAPGTNCLRSASCIDRALYGRSAGCHWWRLAGRGSLPGDDVGDAGADEIHGDGGQDDHDEFAESFKRIGTEQAGDGSGGEHDGVEDAEVGQEGGGGPPVGGTFAGG